MSLPLVLITGTTGYLGAHIVQQALDAGYKVRITARPAKVEAAKQQFEGKVEIVPFDDLINGDYTEALKGIGAIIHAAAPLAGREKPEDMLNNAVGGAVNILKQAAKAGIKRIVVTSSAVTLKNLAAPGVLYSNTIVTADGQSWNPVTREIALAPGTDLMTIYVAAKVLEEHAVWKFADEHPDIDITTINPPFLYGPLPRNIKLASKEAIKTYSTVSLFYTQTLQEPGAGGALAHPQQPAPISVDVRDAALAHILALKAPLTAEVGRKRIIIAGPSFTWLDATEHLKETHPALAAQGRLKDIGTAKKAKDLTILRYDVSRAERVLGLKEFIPWKKTIDDMTDSILAAEKAL